MNKYNVKLIDSRGHDWKIYHDIDNLKFELNCKNCCTKSFFRFSADILDEYLKDYNKYDTFPITLYNKYIKDTFKLGTMKCNEIQNLEIISNILD